MKYTEFGIENEKTLMIFPGGGVYWNPAEMPFVETASKQFHLMMSLKTPTSMRETVRRPISRSISMEKSM